MIFFCIMPKKTHKSDDNGHLICTCVLNSSINANRFKQFKTTPKVKYTRFLV